jgi:hypothetical protein
MATALDKNGREVRVGDRICSTIDPAYIGTAAEVPCGTLGIRVSYDTDHAYAEAREWYSAPENLKLLNAPPLVKDANGNELRVGDRVKLTATGYEASVHRVTASPVVELCEYAAGQPFYALSVNTMRLTPPPPAKDAAEGALWGGDGQSRPLTDIERVRRANADGIPDKPYDINGRLLAVGDRVESTGALCHERRTGEVVEVSVALFGKPLANVIKVRQDDGRTTSSAAGLWRYTAHTRDSEGLRGIVQPGASRFDAGHLAAYHAAIGATHQDYRDA